MRLTSLAFENQGTITSKYTSDGSNVSPPLEISGAPSKTGSLELLVEDPDAPGGILVHWKFYAIPPRWR